jgi:glyoxylase-like metal-dependent hydrolase (beta-lactamase superfamily II)
MTIPHSCWPRGWNGRLLDEGDIPAYFETMRRRKVLPARVIHAGHDPSFGRERLVELARMYLAKQG